MEHKGSAYYNRLLSQYMDGTISSEDRFVLEKRALDDPFLFEALEGYQGKHKVSGETIRELKTKVTNASKKNERRISLFRYGIAASVILMLGIGLWSLDLGNNTNDTIAMNTSVTSEESVDDNYFGDQEAKENIELNPVATVQNTDTRKLLDQNQYDSPKAVISQVENETAEYERVANREVSATNDLVVKELKVESPQSTEGNKIIRINPAPTEVASVTPPTVTSAVPEQEAGIVEEVIVEDASIEETAMEESVPSEDVVSQDKIYSKRKSSIISPKYSSQPRELAMSDFIPSLDITKFKTNFLSDNKATRLAQNSNQEVIIEFSLSKEGSPSRFKIISDSDPACGNKAIDAIKNSGKWISFPANSPVTVNLKMPCL